MPLIYLIVIEKKVLIRKYFHSIEFCLGNLIFIYLNHCLKGMLNSLKTCNGFEIKRDLKIIYSQKNV
jgi:hypothetical protein